MKCDKILKLSCTVTFLYKKGIIFPEPQLCLLNRENHPNYMLMLCLYKSFMATFVDS